MSLPNSSGVSPAASAAAPPPVEPPGVRARSHGLFVRPKTGLLDCQSASIGGTFVLPSHRAGVAHPLLTGASAPNESPSTSAPRRWSRRPRTSIDSLKVIGRPRSGASSPRAGCASAASASPGRGRSRDDDGVQLRVVALDPPPVHLQQLDGGHAALPERGEHVDGRGERVDLVAHDVGPPRRSRVPTLAPPPDTVKARRVRRAQRVRTARSGRRAPGGPSRRSP